MDKKVKLINSHYLGMEDFSNISSLSIIKEVYDRLKLLYDCPIEEEIEEEEANVGKNNLGIMGKFRSFLDEIF